ncbi:MAG: pyridoxal 5'-phosphate synthase glutaminase subunit PdxT [Syntrophobacterales bacterium]|nr:pyridoxal 5'-phosphate synthase glutaminase subunit PdxT [Syntrophobacterales bacterium]
MSSFDFSKQEGASETIGVLNLQGDVFEHLDHLERIGVPCRSVKHANEFTHLAGLIIPGGESTCLSRLLHIYGIDQAIISNCQGGMKIWGTCAGAILLARAIKGENPHLGLIDMEIERNSFGSQLDSFTREASVPRVSPLPMPLTFIRAPKIIRVGSGVDILLRQDDFIAAAESPAVLVTVFHPELTPSLEFHRYFARKCGLLPLAEGAAASPGWDRTSWMRRARLA